MPPHLGGLEVVAQALFDIYATAGYEVRWVASRVPADQPPTEDGRIRVGTWNGLERWLGVPWPIWGPGGIRAVAELVQWADVLHVHDCLYVGSALTAFFAPRAQKPILLSQHIGFVRYTSPILNSLEHLAYWTVGRTVLHRVSHVVFCTPTAEEFVTGRLHQRLPASSTILYGIDTERFRPPTTIERAEARRRLGIPASGRVVLFTGRLVEKKGVDLFLEVGRQHRSDHFLIVGDGPLGPPMLENLTWIQFVPPHEMEHVYRAADVLLLPSHSEGFPMSILEAMATGLPVITSTGQSFATALEREGACLLADRTPQAFGEALNHFWNTPGLAATMSDRSQQLVRRAWGLERMGAQYLELIESLTTDGARRPTSSWTGQERKRQVN